MFPFDDTIMKIEQWDQDLNAADFILPIDSAFPCKTPEAGNKIYLEADTWNFRIYTLL